MMQLVIYNQSPHYPNAVFAPEKKSSSLSGSVEALHLKHVWAVDMLSTDWIYDVRHFSTNPTSKYAH